MDLETIDPSTLNPSQVESYLDSLSLTEWEIKEMGYGSMKDDEKLNVEFTEELAKNEVKSKSLRRSVFEPVLIVKIEKPTVSHKQGDTTVQIIDDSNKDYWISRFPKQWEKYRHLKKNPVNTENLLINWAYTKENKLLLANLGGAKIYTIMELAKLTDKKMEDLNMPELPDLRNKAIKYLEFLASVEDDKTESKKNTKQKGV